MHGKRFSLILPSRVWTRKRKYCFLIGLHHGRIVLIVVVGAHMPGQIASQRKLLIAIRARELKRSPLGPGALVCLLHVLLEAWTPLERATAHLTAVVLVQRVQLADMVYQAVFALERTLALGTWVLEAGACVCLASVSLQVVLKWENCNNIWISS